MSKEDELRFYKFRYLFKINGGIFLFGPKRDKLLYLAIALSVLAYELYHYNLLGTNSILNFVSISAEASITLFGLIIASFAIVTSINNEELMVPMIESRYYAYAIFSFTWALVWSLISVFLSLISVLFSLQIWLFPVVLFSLLYAVFMAFSSMFFSLRQIAIMNTRYNKNLQEAWIRLEERLKDKNKGIK
jgi:hypothetical protein